MLYTHPYECTITSLLHIFLEIEMFLGNCILNIFIGLQIVQTGQLFMHCIICLLKSSLHTAAKYHYWYLSQITRYDYNLVYYINAMPV